MTDAQTVYGLYDNTWKGAITDESFAHPAKMARGLCEWIFIHAIERGWIVPGRSVVLDPFGGVSTTAIIGASRGVRIRARRMD